MKKRIICLLMGLSLFCSAACNELVYAQEVEVDETNIVSTEEPEELEETFENIQETYELILDAEDEIYEVGDVIAITPTLKRYYMEDGVQREEVVEADQITYEMNYDTKKIELVENEDTSGYDFVRKSAEAIEINLIASVTDAIGQTKIIEQLFQLEQLDYQITFKNLREKNSTWLYIDETQYALEVDTDNLIDKKNARIIWEIIDKNSGKKLQTGFKGNETGDTLYLNGEILNTKGFGGKKIVVKAKVMSGEFDTNVLVKTDVEIRKTTTKLKSSIQGTYQLGKKWEYKTTITAFLENGSYPGGKNVSTSIENIKSSNTKVLKITYDKNKKIWTLKTLKTGTSNVTFYLSKNGKEYKVTQKITVTCSHPTTVKSLQLEKILNQAKAWLGRKESDGSHKLIIDIYNSHKPLAINYKVQYHDAWCATYVSAVAIKTGYTTLIPTECGCERMINLFKQREEWKENENCTPKQGWIIFYDWDDNGKGDNKGWSDHVGIVEKVSGKKITVIEGNYDNKVKRRTVEVNGKGIRGYAVPEYGKEITRATTSKNGVITEGCTLCDEGKKTTIYAASKISLEKSDYTYNGKTISPVISVKNSKGNKISKSEYAVSGSTSKKNIGKYSITVTLNGKKYKGTKKLYYTIHPQAPTGVKAVLNGGYNDVKISWKKSSGAAGYNIYYKKSNASEYKKLTSTSKTSCSRKNLNSGTKYTFKIVPYFICGNKKVESVNTKICSVYTLKKMKAPTIVKEAKKSVKISWDDISGESGYQISQSIRSNEITIISNITTTSVTKKTAKNKSYYYRVRPYKKVNGKTVYGPWSDVVKYKLK